MELMLTPGEIRKARLAAKSDWTIEVAAVAGGSFTQVVVKDSNGRWIWNRTFQFETDALDKFGALAGEPIP